MVRHQVHSGPIAVLLLSPTGAVARDMLRRGVRVQSQARRNLAGGAGKPRRIDTGALRASVYVKALPVGVRIGSRLRYARLVHDGTGIYGPRHRMIRAKGRFMVFTPRGSSTVVFARQVRGMTPNPFLADALIAAKD